MNESKFKRELIEWIKSIVFALVITGIIFVTARPSFVNGESMLPTFHDGDLVFVEKLSHFFSEPERGEIIVALTDLQTEDGKKKNVIKRVIGLPGDTVIIKDLKVYINGKELQENYLFEGETGGSFQGTVPEDHIFVLGDNRYNSNDSRSDTIGYIPFNRIKGKVYFRAYPFSDMKLF